MGVVRRATGDCGAMGDVAGAPFPSASKTREERRSRSCCRQRLERLGCVVEARPNDRGSLDFVHDQMANGRRFLVLNVTDDVTHECLAGGEAPGKGLLSSRSSFALAVILLLPSRRHRRHKRSLL